MGYFVAVCLFVTSLIFSSEEEYLKQIYSHLLIRDSDTALKTCEKALASFPESDALKEAYIRSLADNEKDDEAILRWKKWKKEEINHAILETLAWAVLHRSEHSPQIVINRASLLGAFYTQDVRAVWMLKNQMHSSNALLRAMALQLTPQYRDKILIQEVKRLFYEEKVWYVRLEAIKAIGMMGMLEMKEPLKQIIASSQSSAEERGLAMAALVNFYDEIDPNEIKELVKSKRSSLRHLVCQVIAHLDLLNEVPTIITLLDDPIPDVRLAALTTLDLLGLKNASADTLTKIEQMIEDTHPTLSLTASWMTLRFSKEKALKVLRKWVYGKDDHYRRLAAFAIGHSGSAGRSLAEEVMQISPDPFVKVNVALGWVRQEINLELATLTLYNFLMTYSDKLMWDQLSFFQILSPSDLHHISQPPQYPALMDQLTRLDILNCLALLNHPKAAEAIKKFLRHQVFGVSYAASTTLLEEGGEEALKILRDLLKEEDKKVRVQAALVLALSGSELEAVQTLQEAYSSVDREMKIHILEAIGHIGDQKSIPFLLDRLDESHQILKVVIASALIQCLYH